MLKHAVLILDLKGLSRPLVGGMLYSIQANCIFVYILDVKSVTH